MDVNLRRVVSALVAGLLGCGGQGGAQVGTETGPCYPNETCNDGLTCLSDLCVRVVVGDGGTDGAGDGSFQPAPHPRLPQVANLGGPVLTNPRVQPLLYMADTGAADIEAFVAQLAGDSYWKATTGEYGVGVLQVLPSIRISSAPPTTISDDLLQSDLAANTAGPNPAWGAADSSTIYLMILPQGTISTLSSGATCCNDYGGYHSEAQAGAVMLPYAVGCSCPGALGLNLTTLEERTIAISHELVEAVTDPFPLTNPAYSNTDYADYVWTFVTGGETADMCSLNSDSAYALPGTNFLAQRTWSNAAAGRAENPCVPVATTGPYFNSFPTLNSIRYGAGANTFPTQGLMVGLGQTVTIDVNLFSADRTAGNWSVSAYSFEDLLGGDKSNLTLSLDRDQGANGDRLRLSLTPHQANPYLGGEAFILISQYGRPGDPGYQTNLSMGLISN